MNKQLFVLGSLAGLMLINCNRPLPEEDTSGELIFRTGFEPDSEMTGHNEKNVDISGTDHSVDPPNNWDQFDDHPRIGFFHIEFQGGDTSMRNAGIIPDPTSPGNHVLQYWLKYPNVGYEKAYGGKGRIQTDCYENDSLFDIYYSFRMYLTDDWQLLKESEEPMQWFILAEFWNNAAWLDEGHKFRIHLLIKKDEGTGNPLYFGVGAESRGERWAKVWEEENHDFSIPVGQWLNMSLYLKEGDEEHGRFMLTAGSGGKTTSVFDLTRITHHPDDPDPDGFRHFNMFKAYSHRENIHRVREQGGVIRILWDDLELWTELISDPAQAVCCQ